MVKYILIPYKFYLENFRKYEKNDSKLFGGVDINFDRIDLAVIARYGRLSLKRLQERTALDNELGSVEWLSMISLNMLIIMRKSIVSIKSRNLLMIPKNFLN